MQTDPLAPDVLAWSANHYKYYNYIYLTQYIFTFYINYYFNS